MIEMYKCPVLRIVKCACPRVDGELFFLYFWDSIATLRVRNRRCCIDVRVEFGAVVPCQFSILNDSRFSLCFLHRIFYRLCDIAQGTIGGDNGKRFSNNQVDARYSEVGKERGMTWCRLSDGLVRPRWRCYTSLIPEEWISEQVFPLVRGYRRRASFSPLFIAVGSVTSVKGAGLVAG